MDHARVAMEVGTHSIWISEQLKEYGHEVIVANVTELHAISRNDSKSDRTMLKSLRGMPDSIHGYCVRSPSNGAAVTLHSKRGK
jgi:transposase